MRGKEEAHDYRYFPRSWTLVTIAISDEWVDAVRASMPELPLEKRERFMREYEIPAYDAGVLTSSRALADYYEAAVQLCGQPQNWRATGSWGDILRLLNEEKRDIKDCPVSPAALADMIKLIDNGTISR